MRVLIAGGGTGGHLFPGIAVAEEVIARGGEVLFVGTTRGIEARVLPAAGYPLELLTVSGLNRVGPIRMIGGLIKLPFAFLRCLSILRRFRPDVVLGVGGYASGPLVMAAALTGRPSAIQEQNSVPGFTNRVLGKLVRAVFIAFNEAAAAFPSEKVATTGNPVRKGFREARALAPVAAVDATLPTRLLILGGSQGARAVSNLVIGAAALLAKSRPGKFTIVHQTGTSDADRVKGAYAEHGLADVVTVRAFIDDMVSAYRDADLVIARAGALTLAELAIAGVPAILIPLPTAADDHQTRNAAAFAVAGAAVVLPQKQATPEQLAGELESLLDDREVRKKMSAAMTLLARPAAAASVVDRLAALLPGARQA
jgi:UDP-N-acetylglucosamine--N-acetylmuramyl-(pentapeptide) pyrophosphoryl-undecaprenol N-acetylglucosamine transferase